MGRSPRDDVKWLMNEVKRLRSVLIEIAEDDSTTARMQNLALNAANTELIDEWP